MARPGESIVVLVTGFEPFGGSALNPSREVLPRLESRPIPGVDLRTALLPVVGGTGRGSAHAALRDALRRHRPAILLCLGETASRGSIAVERVAINLRDYRIADNAGAIVRDRPVDPSGPAAMMSTLPDRALVDAVRRTGAPCELSLSAGAFLCNEIMYHALRFARRRGLRAAGFVHLPRLPAQGKPGALGARRLGTTLPLPRTVRALRAAIVALRRHFYTPRRAVDRRGLHRTRRGPRDAPAS